MSESERKENAEFTEQQKRDVAKYWALMGQEVDIDSQGSDKYLVENTDSSWIALTGAGSGELNMACIYDANGEVVINRYIELLKKNGVPGTLFIPETVDKSVLEKAIDKGFEDVGEAPLMEYVADRLHTLRGNADILELNEGDSVAAEMVANLQDQVFGFPAKERVKNIHPNAQMRVFVGWDKGKVVSTATTIQVDEKNVGIWSVGTDPNERIDDQGKRLGYGGEILNSVMNTLIRSGAERFHLFSTDSGKRMYDERGFKTIVGGNTKVLEFHPKENHS